MPILEFLLNPFVGGTFGLLLAICAFVLLFQRERLSPRGHILIGAALLLATAYLTVLTFLLWIIIGFSTPD